MACARTRRLPLAFRGLLQRRGPPGAAAPRLQHRQRGGDVLLKQTNGTREESTLRLSKRALIWVPGTSIFEFPFWNFQSKETPFSTSKHFGQAFLTQAMCPHVPTFAKKGLLGSRL